MQTQKQAQLAFFLCSTPSPCFQQETGVPFGWRKTDFSGSMNECALARPTIAAYGHKKTKALRQPIRTQGEVEAAICDGVSRFQLEYMGRGPKDIRSHLIGDLVVIRLSGVLTAAEQHLVQSLPAEHGRNLLKDVRTQLIEVARPALEVMVRESTGIEVLSLHHDVSTTTGEEVIVFTLAEAPLVREKEPKRR